MKRLRNIPRFKDSDANPDSKAQKRKREEALERPVHIVSCSKCGNSQRTLYKSADKKGKKIYLCEYCR